MCSTERNTTIAPVPQSVYPRMDTLDGAVNNAMVQLPITDSNTLIAVLMTYHNTLLYAVQEDGWICNDGSQRLPAGIHPDTQVEVMPRRGAPTTKGRAGSFFWYHEGDNNPADILQYRILN